MVVADWVARGSEAGGLVAPGWVAGDWGDQRLVVEALEEVGWAALGWAVGGLVGAGWAAVGLAALG